jgi:preprotein translocase subunit SecB
MKEGCITEGMNIDDTEEELTRRSSYDTRFEVTIKVTIEAPSADDAHSIVADIVQRGICSLMDELDTTDVEPIYEFDIVNVEPAELF